MKIVYHLLIPLWTWDLGLRIPNLFLGPTLTLGRSSQTRC